jgi:hypothetical protein
MKKASKIQEAIAIPFDIAYLLSTIPVLNGFCHVEVPPFLQAARHSADPMILPVSTRGRTPRMESASRMYASFAPP